MSVKKVREREKRELVLFKKKTKKNTIGYCLRKHRDKLMRTPKYYGFQKLHKHL